MNTLSRLVVGVVTAAILSTGLVAPAGAAEPQPTPATIGAQAPGVRILPGVSPDSALLPAGAVVEEFGSGSTLVLVPKASVGEGMVQPLFSVGVGWTIYIYLNRVDQGAIAAGGATALGVLICASTGAVSCAVVAGALVTAAAYIAAYGLCPSRMEIAIAKGVKCVK